MELDNKTKDNLRLALESHIHCRHENPTYCHMLILAELAMRRGYPVISDEELDACGGFIADAVLESLILKGMVEVMGVTEDGDFTLGLTEAGTKFEANRHKENIYDCDFCGLPPEVCDCGGV